jgi:hypothetical protein
MKRGPSESSCLEMCEVPIEFDTILSDTIVYLFDKANCVSGLYLHLIFQSKLYFVGHTLPRNDFTKIYDPVRVSTSHLD